MPLVVKSDLEWLEKHATWDDEEGAWKCNTTGEFVDAYSVGRSWWDGPGRCGGSGEVKQVLHLNCPGCNPDYKPPNNGSPIRPNQVVVSN